MKLLRFFEMSEDQLSALLAKLKQDPGLQEKLKGAGDLGALVTLAQEAGFAVSEADLRRYQTDGALNLSDSQLESVAGGRYVASVRFGETRCDEGVDCLTFDDDPNCQN